MEVLSQFPSIFTLFSKRNSSSSDDMIGLDVIILNGGFAEGVLSTRDLQRFKIS